MFDAIRFFQHYNIRYWTEGRNVSPGWTNTKCVFCFDNSNHLGWNTSTDDPYCNCWKCGRHSLESSVAKILRVSFDKAADIIRQYQTVYIPQPIVKKKAEATSIKLPGGPLNRFHTQYLESRGFDPAQLVSDYHIQGTGPLEIFDGVNFGMRIIIPIYFLGQLVSFQGRDITGSQERYLGCPIKSSVLEYKTIFYNWDHIQFQRAVVVEGIFDVWRMGDGYIGSFGTEMTPAQIRLLSTLELVTFLFDPEPEAQQRAKKYAQQLSSLGVAVDVACIDIDRDPGDLSVFERDEAKKQLGV